MRASFALISYFGFTIAISQLVVATLPPPNSLPPTSPGSATLVFHIRKVASRILRTAVNSFVWGKLHPEQDWNRIFGVTTQSDTRALLCRIMVGAVGLGMFELLGIMVLIRSRKLAFCIPMHFLLSAFFVEPDGGRIATWMRSFSMIFVTMGVTR